MNNYSKKFALYARSEVYNYILMFRYFFFFLIAEKLKKLMLKNVKINLNSFLNFS